MAKKKDAVQEATEKETEDKNLPEKAEPVKPEIIDEEEEKLINDAVKFINEKANEVIYKGHEEIGSYILEKFFNGDIEKALSKDPKKEISFKKLCERGDLIVHANTLSAAVKVSCQEKLFIDKKFNDSKLLSYTHKKLLVRLEDPRKKVNMAKKCIKEGWTTRELENAVQKKLKEFEKPAKKSLIRTTQKCIQKIDTVIEAAAESDLSYKSEDLKKMSGARRRELIKHANDLKSKIDAIDLGDVSSNCESLIEELEKIEEEYKKNPPKRGRKSKKNMDDNK
ncbi:hypothetical protein MTBBW1_2550008 [Desulfamplus magnetovallimortis]|uniref:ParB/Spo0J HTH domain-containing protein n=1 Tax=Desulfamplus magnetovallimortis TaxID=1246637 RepID=A0A1W1HEM9_9BACT|nr:hypothetical protein [Desulfamplus magnetovallimortis]SLM30954.1 hypothetical protein MTBBW1_2550008 [Desulfamplus magnetovallimortis]